MRCGWSRDKTNLQFVRIGLATLGTDVGMVWGQSHPPPLTCASLLGAFRYDDIMRARASSGANLSTNQLIFTSRLKHTYLT